MLAEYYSFILDTCLDHVNSTQSNQVISDSCTERLKAVIFNVPAPSSVDQVKCLVIHSPSTLLGRLHLFNWSLKGYFTQQMKFCHRLLTLKLFQTLWISIRYF